ncbi:MAG TPA: YdcF family protein [Alphaproteobacteria bacterium]|nr:YdcF family protein [Alphaproteobacteria bacterium]
MIPAARLALRFARAVARALLRLARNLLFALGTLVIAWGLGLLWFVADIPRAAPAADDRRTDAIVVLTGGSDRVATGLALLSQGKARTLFVSGVHDGVDVPTLTAAARLSADQPDCCIVLGYAAADTEGNALETAAWMRSRGYTSLRLVTANYHMRRSLVEFARVLPGIEILPHPVAPRSVVLGDWWRRPGTLSLVANEYNKYLVALLRAAVSPRNDE